MSDKNWKDRKDKTETFQFTMKSSNDIKNKKEQQQKPQTFKPTTDNNKKKKNMATQTVLYRES